MSVPPSVARTVANARRLDRTCRSFERDWRTSSERHLEKYLEQATSYERPVWLAELMAIEIELRCLAGEIPELPEYLRRFPQSDHLVRQTFAESMGHNDAGDH